MTAGGSALLRRLKRNRARILERARREKPTGVLLDGNRLTVGQLEDLFLETHPIGGESRLAFRRPVLP